MERRISTPEELDKHYNAMIDSVNLINQIVSGDTERFRTDDLNLIVKANVDHLKIMLERELWGDRNLDEIHSAIATGESYLAS
jgi:hypothetical protein